MDLTLINAQLDWTLCALVKMGRALSWQKVIDTLTEEIYLTFLLVCDLQHNRAMYDAVTLPLLGCEWAAHCFLPFVPSIVSVRLWTWLILFENECIMQITIKWHYLRMCCSNGCETEQFLQDFLSHRVSKWKLYYIVTL